MVTAHSPSKNKKAALLLEDGTFSIGYWFGVLVKVSSEVVVSTFTGYPFMDAHDANSEIPFHFEPNRIQVTVLAANGEGMTPHCGVSAIPVDKWLTNSATLNERRCG